MTADRDLGSNVPRRRAARALLGLVIWAGAGAVVALERPTAAELLAEVQRWLDGTRDLEARFEQELVSGALGTGLEESGRVYVKRPGRMRWDYLEPEIKVALLDGERTRLYLAEDRQLWESTLSEEDSLLPQLLAGDRPLAEVFDVDFAAGEPARAGPLRLRLVPRGAAASLEEVVLVVRDPSRVALDEIEVLDATGNRIVYRFSGLVRNRGLAEDTFSFVPPAGTEVVSDRPGGAG